MSYTETENFPMPSPPNIPRVDININHKSDSTSELKAAIVAANQALWGEHSKPVPQPTHDEYGTPLRLLEIPDVFDSKEGRLDMDRRYVTAMSMLAMRMKWGPFNEYDAMHLGSMIPFDHVSIHRGTEKVSVFIVAAGEPVTVVDDPNMFPSDELVGKIRLLEAANKAKQE